MRHSYSLRNISGQRRGEILGGRHRGLFFWFLCPFAVGSTPPRRLLDHGLPRRTFFVCKLDYGGVSAEWRSMVLGTAFHWALSRSVRLRSRFVFTISVAMISK
jgi:hypothetical protein